MPWTGNLGKQMGFPGIGFPGLLAVGSYCILFWREYIFQCHNGILSIFNYNGSLLILRHEALPGMAQPDTILLQCACENSLISALSFQARNYLSQEQINNSLFIPQLSFAAVVRP